MVRPERKPRGTGTRGQGAAWPQGVGGRWEASGKLAFSPSSSAPSPVCGGGTGSLGSHRNEGLHCHLCPGDLCSSGAGRDAQWASPKGTASAVCSLGFCLRDNGGRLGGTATWCQLEGDTQETGGLWEALKHGPGP